MRKLTSSPRPLWLSVVIAGMLIAVALGLLVTYEAAGTPWPSAVVLLFVVVVFTPYVQRGVRRLRGRPGQGR